VASAPLDLSPLWISLRTSAAATAITFVLGLLVAHAMSRYRGKGKELIDGVLTLKPADPSWFRAKSQRRTAHELTDHGRRI
jgi:ABC-type sulfate transport system permease component